MGYRLTFRVTEENQVTRTLTTQGSGPFAKLICGRLRREYDAEITLYAGSTADEANTYRATWFDDHNDRFREALVTVLNP